MSLKEYKTGTTFPGVIGRTVDRSSPAWPEPLRARKGSPNVLFIVLDDTGFGQLGCYGSPIETPHLNSLAANGLRYNNMHTTALCSPSRSCVITGRNHHSNAMSLSPRELPAILGAMAIFPLKTDFCQKCYYKKATILMPWANGT